MGGGGGEGGGKAGFGSLISFSEFDGVDGGIMIEWYRSVSRGGPYRWG